MTYTRLQHEPNGAVLLLTGQWNLPRIAEIDAELGAARLPASAITLDGSRLQALDTAAALALLIRLGKAGATIAGLIGVNRSHARVIEAVRARMDGDAPAPRRRRYGPLAALGVAAVKIGWALHCHLEFLGRCVAALGEVARHPARLRWKELAAQLQQVCIEAIPVVALVTFLIGMVLAYLFGMQAEKFGASIFVVDAVAIGAVARDRPAAGGGDHGRALGLGIHRADRQHAAHRGNRRARARWACRPCRCWCCRACWPRCSRCPCWCSSATSPRSPARWRSRDPCSTSRRSRSSAACDSAARVPPRRRRPRQRRGVRRGDRTDRLPRGDDGGGATRARSA